MKDKPITLGYIAWHDKIGDTDASVVQIYKNAGGERTSARCIPRCGVSDDATQLFPLPEPPCLKPECSSRLSVICGDVR
jgi:hypothetical protein